jgi:hypothetical protein
MFSFFLTKLFKVHDIELCNNDIVPILQSSLFLFAKVLFFSVLNNVLDF